MKAIYWVSQHDLTPSQKKALASCRVVKDPRPFANADQIVKRYRESGCEDMIVVAPLSVLQALVKKGIRPVWAEMVETSPGDGEVCLGGHAATGSFGAGRWVKFKRFLRVRNVNVEFEDEPVVFHTTCDVCGGFGAKTAVGDDVCPKCKGTGVL